MSRIMLKLIGVALIAVLAANANGRPTGFVHPSNFIDTASGRNSVISYIKSNVKRTYSELGIGDPMTLRMMENEELGSFKASLKVANKSLLDEVIGMYCDDLDLCSYTNLLMMYEEQDRASNTELEW